MRNLKQELINEVVYSSIKELMKVQNFTLKGDGSDERKIALEAASQQYDAISSIAKDKIMKSGDNPSIQTTNTISREVRTEVAQLIEKKTTDVNNALEEFQEPSVQFLDEKGKPKETTEEKNELIKELVSKKMLEKINDFKQLSLHELASMHQAKPKLSEEKRRSIVLSAEESPKPSRRISFRAGWTNANVGDVVRAADAKKAAAQSDMPGKEFKK